MKGKKKSIPEVKSDFPEKSSMIRRVNCIYFLFYKSDFVSFETK